MRLWVRERERGREDADAGRAPCFTRLTDNLLVVALLHLSCTRRRIRGRQPRPVLLYRMKSIRPEIVAGYELMFQQYVALFKKTSTR